MDYVLCGPNRMSKNMTIFCSYLSNEEVPTINVPNPNNLFSLGKWLKARKYAYSKLFSGHLNVKGDLNDYDIIKWKKSYVRIFGYTIYLFNYKSKKSTGIININEAKPTISETNTISLNLVNYERILELHTDSKEDFQKLKTAIEILFPKEKL
ncbi:hypothetical protein HERIO_2458 [Hepatospora eriocheir]|uniref:PH domain-containing protein n=1 Tax=Hepatospora eriocheir TaxID=1081669 RepID=A0A1X0Q6W4_9MICR|nr:hypothetical protein HERIO_2458 [Hepatospora eriocheir]